MKNSQRFLDAFKNIEKIYELISSLPKVYPKFKKGVFFLDSTDSISTALSKIYSNSYSQIPIFKDGIFHDLLTSNTITKWLGDNIKENIFSLRETSVDLVLKASENNKTYKFIKKNNNYFDVL